jgi:hypothetical protein
MAPSGHLASWLTPEAKGYDGNLFLRESFVHFPTKSTSCQDQGPAQRPQMQD